MTTDEAMQAVNKAVEFIPYLEARVNLSNRNPKRPDGETIEEILLAALRAIAPGGPLAVLPGEPTHRHKKRGSVYRLIGNAKLQSGWPLREDDLLAIYQAQDGTLWARPYEEFNDGRFELLAEGEKS